MSIWKEIDEHYTIANGFTDRDIDSIERELNISIPVHYLDLLREQNGGLLIYDSLRVDFENSWDEGSLPFTSLYGISSEFTVLNTKETLGEWGITGNNLLIGGDGTYLYFLNFDKDPDDPAVCYLDVSTDVSREVANSFEELISKLYTQDDGTEHVVDSTNPEAYVQAPSPLTDEEL